jgi:hypothetical protein
MEEGAYPVGTLRLVNRTLSGAIVKLQEARPNWSFVSLFAGPLGEVAGSAGRDVQGSSDLHGFESFFGDPPADGALGDLEGAGCVGDGEHRPTFYRSRPCVPF